MKRIARSAALFMLVLGLPTDGSASNGYFAHGYGTESKGLAGAGSALTLGTLSGVTNPAAIAFIGARTEVGLALFNPNRDYTVIGSPSGFPGTFGLAPGEVTSGSSYFPVPSFGISRPIGDQQAVALTLCANGGMNTDYDSPTFGSTPTGVDLAQLFLGPTYARRIAERHALGASAVIGFQRFAAKGLAAFSGFSSDPNNLSDRGYSSSLGFGMRAGYRGDWTRWFSAGLAYQSRMRMSELDSYAGLFAEGGDFDVPSNWTAGIAVKPSASVDLVADVQRTNYSEVRSIANPLLPNLTLEPLGQAGGAGFGWNDITTWKLGAQARTGERWTWRGGYSFSDQPIPASEVLFNILAPGVIEQHASLGFTRRLAGSRAASVELTRAFSHKVSGPNPLEAPGQQQIQLRMDQWELEVGFAWGAR